LVEGALPRRSTPGLTDAELRLMEVLWGRGAATVAEVVQALPKKAPLAYSSVLTTLRILENKGYLSHEQEGRAFIYRPVVRRDQARESAVSHLVRRFFHGSRERLMLALLKDEGIGTPEIERLRRLIEEDRK
jgi:predicted transcriptional regulator